LLKQTTVQFEENSVLQTLLHSVALASFTQTEKNPRTSMTQGLLAGPKPLLPTVLHVLCLIAGMKRLQMASLIAA